MFKKLFYFFSITTLYFLLSFQEVAAKEYCHLYLDGELSDTVELPFYFYEISRESKIENSAMPTIVYKRKETYIDSLTKCKAIETTITYNVISLYDSLVADYSIEKSTLTYNEHFNKAKFQTDGSNIKGLGTSIDEEFPVISGYQEQYVTNISNPLSLDFIMSFLSAHDNLDGNITNKIKVEYDEYTSNLDKVGNYPIIISVQDAASNKTSTTFHIEIIDTTAPTISGKNTFISYLSSPINIEEIKNELSAYDNADKDLTAQIFICEDLYSANKDKIGEYSLYFCVYDKSDNLSPTFKVSISVKDDIPPIIEGLDYFTSKMSYPLTTKEIMYSLAASDNSEDVSNSIFITSDNYSNFQNYPGEKAIYFQAMDKSNNLSSPFKVTINLLDDISPQIYGLNMFESYLSSPLSLTYIKQQLTVIDNVDGNISSSLEILSDSYSSNINNKGTFYITFQAKDSSSNISEEYKITINCIDDIPPYIEGPSNLTYKIEEKPSIQLILSKYSAKDNTDKIIEIQVLEENYSSSLDIGLYFVKLSCKDSENNTSAPYMIQIEITEQKVETKNYTLIVPTSTLLSLDEINKLINLTTSSNTIEDTYTPNYSINGSYLIKYELENKNIININIKTFSQKEEKKITLTTTQKKETFLTKIKRFFQKIFNFIKRLFSKINPLKGFQYYLQYHFYF